MGILLEAEALSLLPSRHFSTGSWSCFPGMEQWLWADPVGTGHSRQLLSLSLWFVCSSLTCSRWPLAPIPSEGR